MRNPHLVPEKRTDKRGVTATRWVRPDKGGAGRHTSIPAPETSPPQRATALSSLRSAMSDWYEHAFETRLWQGEPNWLSWADFSSRLDGIDSRVLVEGQRLVAEHPGAGFEYMLRACVVRDEDPRTALYILHLAELRVESDALDLGLVGSIPLSYSTLYRDYMGLLHYGLDLPEDPFTAPARDRLRIGALIRAKDSLEDHFDEYGDSTFVEASGVGFDGKTIIRDRGIAQLVYDRPEEHERIAAIVLERGGADPQTVAAVLNSETPALADGSL